MRKSSTLILLILTALFAQPYARADETPGPNPAHPWEKDQALLATIQQEIKSAGITSVRPHVAEMERALAGAKFSLVVDEPTGRTVYSLSDGLAEALVAAS